MKKNKGYGHKRHTERCIYQCMHQNTFKKKKIIQVYNLC